MKFPWEHSSRNLRLLVGSDDFWPKNHQQCRNFESESKFYGHPNFWVRNGNFAGARKWVEKYGIVSGISIIHLSYRPTRKSSFDWRISQNERRQNLISFANFQTLKPSAHFNNVGPNGRMSKFNLSLNSRECLSIARRIHITRQKLTAVRINFYNPKIREF